MKVEFEKHNGKVKDSKRVIIGGKSMVISPVRNSSKDK